MKPTSRDDALRIRDDEHLPLALFEGARNHMNAIVVDQLDDGRIQVFATDERAGTWEGSLTIHASESAALDDALRRARALGRYAQKSRQRHQDAIDAWRLRGGDAWLHGESGLWLKGVYHSGGPRWQAYRAMADRDPGAAGALGFVTQSPDGFRASPPRGFHDVIYGSSADAERALIALAEERTDSGDQ